MVDIVQNIFENWVFNGQLCEGMKFTEASLCEAVASQGLKLSRTPIRENIAKWSKFGGIMDATPGSGTIIVELDDNRRREFIERRFDVELRRIQNLIAVTTNQPVELRPILFRPLIEQIDLMKYYSKTGNYANFFQSDLNFRLQLCTIGSSEAMASFIRIYYLRTFLSLESKLLFPDNEKTTPELPATMLRMVGADLANLNQDILDFALNHLAGPDTNSSSTAATLLAHNFKQSFKLLQQASNLIARSKNIKTKPIAFAVILP